MAKPHYLDTVLVKNIDIDCTDTTHDVVPSYQKEVDEETGATYQRFGERAYEFNHAEYFSVRWAGQEHKLAPGEERLMPRFVAEHFAKHLADHILGKREMVEKKTGYVTSSIERPKTLAKILVKVVQQFEGGGIEDEGLAALAQVSELNLGNGEVAKPKGRGVELREIDGGDVPNTAVGVLTDAAPQSLEDVLEAAGEAPEAKPLPSRPELIKEAHALGIPFDPKATREELANKIKAF